MHDAIMNLFPEREREKIRSAVRSAERVTSGEIVPFVVGQSDHYEAAEWRGAAVALLAVVAAVVIFRDSAGWPRLDPAGAGTAALLAAGAAMIAVRWIPPLRRLLAGRRLMARRVAQRAAEAFVSEEVFATPKRTGILIFLSLLERRVMVIGDSGINTRVPQEEWQGIIRTVVEAIRSGHPADGLVRAIGECGDLLARHGVGREAGDRDALGDDLRLSRE